MEKKGERREKSCRIIWNSLGREMIWWYGAGIGEWAARRFSSFLGMKINQQPRVLDSWPWEGEGGERGRQSWQREMCQQTSNNNGHTAVTASSAVSQGWAGRVEEVPDQDKRASISNWVMIPRWFVTKLYARKKHAMKATKNAEQSNNKNVTEKTKKNTKSA